MSTLQGAGRQFIVGETIHLRSRVSLPGTKTPVDPATVELSSLILDGVETLVAPTPFVRDAEGDFSLVVETAAMDPGSYTLRIRHADGTSKVTLVKDGFVLQAA